MRVYLASDHAGFQLKAHLLAHLPSLGYDAVDCGAAEYVDGDDYPPYCLLAASRVAADPGSLAIVIGGSGNGEQIAANKVKGIRAALAWSDETARLARQHNDANVVAVGGRMHGIEEATRFIEIFLATPFSQDARHIRRIDQVTSYEASEVLPSPGPFRGGT